MTVESENNESSRDGIIEKYLADCEVILAHRYDLGSDYWTTPDKHLIKGSPFSMLESISYLQELGTKRDDPILKDCVELIFSTWQENGSFKLYPQGSVYPCQTANAVNTLCHMGYAEDIRVQKRLRHLLDIQQNDGGWRCNKFSYGKGPETRYSNPFPTLVVLDAFRFTEDFRKKPALDNAVDFLLEHWVIKKPIGPCHYGIGSLFMQVEYPFRSYNLLMYVYVLSFYKRARQDSRFIEAFNALNSKTVDGQIVVERVSPKLANLSFCKKGKPSDKATKRYQEILIHMNES